MPMTIATQTFSQLLLQWFDKHGRKNLPWQQTINPYRVWISEIMLQQTQVTTVIPYFQRFIGRFPDVTALAKAEQDEVLHYWTGLGYYARARNLHRAARIIQQQYAGQLPADLLTLQSLPGIGRSTAGAILSIAQGKAAPILDGNVKRVLARFHAVTGWPGQTHVTKQLWQYAEQYTPQERFADYTQAIMDLGATICTRSKPRCNDCPLTQNCQAHAQQCETAYPQKKPSKKLPVRAINLLIFSNPQGEILLQRRPPTGIWGGLWSFPECPKDQIIEEWCQQTFHCDIDDVHPWPGFRHTFSHFHLDITPILLKVTHWRPRIMDSNDTVWYNIIQPAALGLAAPVKQLLHQLGKEQIWFIA